MPDSNSTLAALGLTHLLAEPALAQEPQGSLRDALQRGVIAGSAEWTRGLRHVLEREQRGAWRRAMKAAGQADGRSLAARLETQLAALAQPKLSGLPLEACLALLTRAFAAAGWGRLALDLAHAAEHGLVVAKLEHSYFAATFPRADEFVDPLPAGVLQAFFEHISGQALDCEEVACQARGAPQCVFVIAAAERLAPLLPQIGHADADTLIARLRE